MIALIDNYDSFTFNVYHYLSVLCDVEVFRNTESLDRITALDVQGIVISPGPSHPAQSKLSLEVIDHFKGQVPILGICLGMQAIGYQFGKKIRRARSVMHGKVDRIDHSGGTLFKGIDQEFLGGQISFAGGRVRRQGPGRLRRIEERRRGHGHRTKGRTAIRASVSPGIVCHPGRHAVHQKLSGGV